MQLIMQSATVAKTPVGLRHRNQTKPVVGLTAFGKSAPIRNPIWSGPYVPRPDPTQPDGQPMFNTYLLKSWSRDMQ